jgi:hypothetical protein
MVLDGRNVFRDWYNSQRPIWIHRGRTPEEVYGVVSKFVVF